MNSVLQTIFHRPSQKYSFPTERHLHSRRHDILHSYPSSEHPPTQQQPQQQLPLYHQSPPVSIPTLPARHSSEFLPSQFPDPDHRNPHIDPDSTFFIPGSSPTMLLAVLDQPDPSPLPSKSLLVAPVQGRPSISPTTAPRPVPRQPPPSPLNKAFTRATPSITTSMTVLLDHDSVSPKQTTYVRHHRNPKSHILISNRPASYSSLPSSPSSTQTAAPSSQSPKSHPTPGTPPCSPGNLRRTRSKSLENLDNLNPSLPPRPQTHYEPTLPSSGTPGFTSLTLPRAPPPSGLIKAPGDSRPRLDLTLDGLAQTTMASIEVVRGLGSTHSGLGILGKLGLGPKKIRASIPAPRVLNGHATGEKILAFTSHRAPPKNVPSTCVLVQVWAVAVDVVDAKLVGVNTGQRTTLTRHSLTRSTSLKDRFMRRATASAKSQQMQQTQQQQEIAEVGYIPGRSFVGRVVETGWDVKDELAKKGDWVMGSTDIRKVNVQSSSDLVLARSLPSSTSTVRCPYRIHRHRPPSRIPHSTTLYAHRRSSTERATTTSVVPTQP